MPQLRIKTYAIDPANAEDISEILKEAKLKNVTAAHNTRTNSNKIIWQQFYGYLVHSIHGPLRGYDNISKKSGTELVQWTKKFLIGLTEEIKSNIPSATTPSQYTQIESMAVTWINNHIHTIQQHTNSRNDKKEREERRKEQLDRNKQQELNFQYDTISNERHQQKR